MAEKRSDTLCKKEKLTRYHTMFLNQWCDRTKSRKEMLDWRILVKLGVLIVFNRTDWDKLEKKCSQFIIVLI